MQPDPQKRARGLAALVAIAGLGVLLFWHHGGMPESESSLTAEIRTALDGDTEAAGKFADLFAAVPKMLESSRVKSAEDLKEAMIAARDSMKQGHVESLRPITTRELACLEADGPLDSSRRSEIAAACKRLSAAYRAAASKSQRSVADTLRSFADKMEARQ